jgi:hypothetical protein
MHKRRRCNQNCYQRVTGLLEYKTIQKYSIVQVLLFYHL